MTWTPKGHQRWSEKIKKLVVTEMFPYCDILENPQNQDRDNRSSGIYLLFMP